MLGVSKAEAAHQLHIQDIMDGVDYEALDSGFAEVVSTPGQNFRIYYYTTNAGPAAVEQVFERLGLGELVTYRAAPFSAGRVDRALRLAAKELASSEVDLSADLAAGEIVVNSTQPSPAEAPSSFEGVPVRWNVVNSLAHPTVGGGGDMTECTGGFVVESVSTGNRGISSAGHCTMSTTYYAGYLMTFMGQSLADSSDVEWWDNAQISWGARFYAGASTGNLDVTRRLARSDMNIGDIVCSYGKVTDRNCGNVTVKNFCPGYVPSCDPTFIRVHNANNYNMNSVGDSGGPVYNGTTAWGLISGEVGVDLIFMPQQYVNTLGLQVAIQ